MYYTISIRLNLRHIYYVFSMNPEKQPSKNNSCKIIMETVMVERMREAFYFEAFRFIVKPIEREEVDIPSFSLVKFSSIIPPVTIYAAQYSICL